MHRVITFTQKGNLNKSLSYYYGNSGDVLIKVSFLQGALKFGTSLDDYFLFVSKTSDRAFIRHENTMPVRIEYGTHENEYLCADRFQYPDKIIVDDLADFYATYNQGVLMNKAVTAEQNHAKGAFTTEYVFTSSRYQCKAFISKVVKASINRYLHMPDRDLFVFFGNKNVNMKDTTSYVDRHADEAFINAGKLDGKARKENDGLHLNDDVIADTEDKIADVSKTADMYAISDKLMDIVKRFVFANTRYKLTAMFKTVNTERRNKTVFEYRKFSFANKYSDGTSIDANMSAGTHSKGTVTPFVITPLGFNSKGVYGEDDAAYVGKYMNNTFCKDYFDNMGKFNHEAFGSDNTFYLGKGPNGTEAREYDSFTSKRNMKLDVPYEYYLVSSEPWDINIPSFNIELGKIKEKLDSISYDTNKHLGHGARAIGANDGGFSIEKNPYRPTYLGSHEINVGKSPSAVYFEMNPSISFDDVVRSGSGELTYNNLDMFSDKYAIPASFEDTLHPFKKVEYKGDDTSNDTGFGIDKAHEPIYTGHTSEDVFRVPYPTFGNDTTFDVGKWSVPTSISNEYTKAGSKTGKDTVADNPGNFLDKDEQESYVIGVDSYGTKVYKDFDTDNGEFLEKPKPDVRIIEQNIRANYDLHMNFYNQLVVSDCTINKTDIAKTIHVYDTNIKQGQFNRYEESVYIEREEDPSTLSPHDELILPHSAYDYTEYRDKLFMNGDIDPMYVKRYNDDGTMTINVPIENPIVPMTNVANEYIELDVNILYYIIKKAFTIWKAGIYKYACMKSKDALNDILMKTRENLEIKFTTKDKMHHALRAMRLFHWYCEMSILNNAEYVLKLDCEDATVDFENGNFGKLSSLIISNNLHFTSTYELENTNKSMPSSVDGEFTAYHKTGLRLLAYVNGTLRVNINGDITTYTNEVVDTTMNFDIGHNRFEILHMPDGPSAIDICELAVVNYEIVKYDLKYAGKIGETNATLDYLLKYLCVVGDSIEEAQGALAHGAPVAYALDKLREYFELHHEDKDKGRRLINKTL